MALGASIIAHSSIASTVATFPLLNAETRLPGSGPVAISGETAIVGNFVYVRTPAGWLFQQILNGFGAVALDGDMALVGTNIYTRSGTEWSFQATLPLSYWGGNETIAIDQNLIAVGIPYAYVSNAYFAGVVDIFQKTNSTVTLQSQLTPGDPVEATAFGGSVALNGQTLVAGAPGDLYGGDSTAPAAYIFALKNRSWTQEAKLTNDTPVPSFGGAVAVSGNTVAVGATYGTNPVMLFTRRGTRWPLSQSLSWTGPSLPDHGYDVNPLAMKQNVLAALDDGGTAHIFTLKRSAWIESQTLASGSSNILGSALGLTTNSIITSSSSTSNAFIFEPQSWTWQQRDIGDVGAAGSFSAGTNSLSVSGAGANIGGTADAFHFVFRPYSNDLEMVVHVESIGGSDSYSRGGIMFRSSLDPGAPYVFVSQRQGQQIFFEYRYATNAQGVIDWGPWVGAPYWLKLRKLGSNFVASTSQDGNIWNDFGPTNISMPDNFYIGLGVTSERTGILATDVFDHVEINPIALPAAVTGLTATATGVDSINLTWTDNSDNASAIVVKRSSYGYYSTIATLPPNTTNFSDTGLAHNTTYSYIVQAIEPHGYGHDSEPASATTLKLPAPWLDQDIGPTQVGGSAALSYSGYEFNVTSGATNSAVGGLHFIYQQLTGDFDIRAWVQINLWTGSAIGTQAGLMVRSSLDPASPYAFAYSTEKEGDRFVTKDSSGATTTSVASGAWIGELRMVRKGNVLTVFHFDRGLTDVALTQMAQQTVVLSSNVYVGFAIAGQDGGQPLSGEFSDIYLGSGSNVQSIVQPVLTATPLSPTQVQLPWTDANVNPLHYQAGYVQKDDYGDVDFYLLGWNLPNLGWLSSNTTSYLDGSMVPGMSRNYRAKVELSDGDWLWSNYAPATTPLPVFNLPPPWQLARIGVGSPAPAAVYETNRSFFVSGAGHSIGGTADDCSGVFRPLTGDGSMTVRLAEAVDTTGSIDPAGRFGIMIRQSLDPRAAAAAVFAMRSPYWATGFMSRTNEGATAGINVGNNYDAIWLKIVRAGPSIAGYSSSDGITWTELGSASINFTNPVAIGLFAELENGSVLASGNFDNLQMAPPQAPALSFKSLDPAGNAWIELDGFPGWTNQIEVSTDLVHWEPLTNDFNVSGSLEISDPAARTNAIRFYRATIQY